MKNRFLWETGFKEFFHKINERAGYTESIKGYPDFI